MWKGRKVGGGGREERAGPDKAQARWACKAKPSGFFPSLQRESQELVRDTSSLPAPAPSLPPCSSSRSFSVPVLLRASDIAVLSKLRDEAAAGKVSHMGKEGMQWWDQKGWHLVPEGKESGEVGHSACVLAQCMEEGRGGTGGLALCIGQL